MVSILGEITDAKSQQNQHPVTLESTKKRDFRAKSGGSGTFTWTLHGPRGVRSCKLDTYGIYINDLWKNSFFWNFFFNEKSWKEKICFPKNPEIHKIRKSWNHKNSRFSEKNIFSIQDFSLEKIKFSRENYFFVNHLYRSCTCPTYNS